MKNNTYEEECKVRQMEPDEKMFYKHERAIIEHIKMNMCKGCINKFCANCRCKAILDDLNAFTFEKCEEEVKKRYKQYHVI